MKGRGRPLRFLALVFAGWMALRVAMLWPHHGTLGEAVREAVPFASLPSFAPDERAAPVPPPDHAVAHAPAERPAEGAAVSRAAGTLLPVPGPAAAAAAAAAQSHAPRDPVRVQFALMGLVQYGDIEPVDAAPDPRWSPAVALPPATASAVRWSGSAWVVARGGTGIGAAPGAGQIGGAQAGARVAWLLSPSRRIALVARATAPLHGRGAEAAVAIEWQPGDLPLRLVAEHRFGLDGAPGGTGLGLVAWADETLPSRFRLEAYGQAGFVKRARVEPYADGAARMTHAVAGSTLRLSLGAGAWGAAQRDAQRLDIGPSALADLRVGDRTLRAALDWRQRVAGDALPGSGAVLTLGTDF